jgi:hypothetical protein
MKLRISATAVAFVLALAGLAMAQSSGVTVCVFNGDANFQTPLSNNSSASPVNFNFVGSLKNCQGANAPFTGTSVWTASGQTAAGASCGSSTFGVTQFILCQEGAAFQNNTVTCSGPSTSPPCAPTCTCVTPTGSSTTTCTCTPADFTTSGPFSLSGLTCAAATTLNCSGSIASGKGFSAAGASSSSPTTITCGSGASGGSTQGSAHFVLQFLVPATFQDAALGNFGSAPADLTTDLNGLQTTNSDCSAGTLQGPLNFSGSSESKF